MFQNLARRPALFGGSRQKVVHLGRQRRAGQSARAASGGYGSGSSSREWASSS
jgi:hypothetical protein